MKNALFKDTFREIRRTLSRFLSIFAIVALGVSFFAGLKATSPDMKITADKYFDDYRLMDIRVISTMGFNDNDINAIKKVSGAEGIFPSYSMDALVNVNDKDRVVKILTVPMDKIHNPDKSYINRIKLVEGRYPEKPGECLAERGKMLESSMSIGSTLKLSSGSDKDISESLKTDEFTIVGIVETPYYISFERGTSTIGNGKINSFIMIPEEDFNMSVYTDVFITVKEAREVLCYDDEYDNILDPIKESIKNIGKDRAKMRYDEVILEANQELNANKRELEEAEEKQRIELSDAESKLEKAKKQIEDGEKELNKKEREFNTLIKDAESKLKEESKKLEDGEKEYNLKLQSFNEMKIQSKEKFLEAEQKIDYAQKEIDKKEAEINQLKTTLSSITNEEEKAKIKAIIETGEKELSYAKAQLASSRTELENNKMSISKGENELANAKKTLIVGKEQLEKERERLEESKKKASDEFLAAHKKLDNSKKDFEKGQEEYEDAKTKSNNKIEEAHKKIADAEKEIKKLEKPKWYVIKRSETLDFIDYGMAADRIDAISQVFPVFFFVIAVLVCLTTMTRMVDEQRTYIGTFKALGYSGTAIASKYLIYATAASISGSIVGLLVGFKVFPTVIFNAYRIMYTMPPIITEFNVFYAIISTAFAVLATTLAALVACYNELVETPALLMRPKSPKAGKRILLERIKFIWSRFNFTQKVTARNLFRYKKRFIMTIVGISGCTALLLAGFGLKDSIVSIATKQFDEIYQYDMAIELKNGIKSGEAIDLINIMDKDSRISDYMFMKEQNIDIGKGSTEKTVSLIVPENIDNIRNFIVLRNRTTGETVPFNNEGVVLTEKLAKILEVEIGDEIYIKDENNKINVKVIGITENYVAHYIYMSPNLFESIYEENIEFQKIVAKTTEVSESFEDKLSRDLLKDDEVASINFTTGVSKNFKDIIGSLNYVVLVLIASAGALAFVVLYNLTNINVSERIREIATIKVLGFYDKEVSTYVYRENFILTLIGMMLGLILGTFLHKFIVVTGEIEYVMFGRNINAISYVYSSMLTILFAGLVNFVMYFRLKRVGMVESLKSVD